MEKLLTEFVDTLDMSLKKIQAEVGVGPGLTSLTYNQFQYINAIHELGQPTITQIAGRLNITKASVTTGINKLVQMGYVVKIQSNEDRRVFHARLTEPGEQLVQAKVQALKTYGNFISAALSQEEARQFEAILAKLVRVFKQG